MCKHRDTHAFTLACEHIDVHTHMCAQPYQWVPEPFVTLLILITFNHSRHTPDSTVPPLQSCDVRILRGWPGSPAGR